MVTERKCPVDSTDLYWTYQSFVKTCKWGLLTLHLHVEQVLYLCNYISHNVISCVYLNHMYVPLSLSLLRALGHIGRYPYLHHLDLSGCLRISGDGLHSLVDVCPNLEPASLYYCDNIVDGPHADLASGCQNLECGNRVCCRSGQ